MNECTEMEYSMSDLKKLPRTPHLNLPDLVEEACYVPEDGSAYMVIECSPSSRYKGGCPCCGSALITAHGYLPQRRLVHDVRVGVQQIDLLVKVPRYTCSDCSGSFTHQFESIPDKRQMTTRLFEQIRRDSFIRPFIDVATEFGYTVPTIGAIFDEYAKELEAKRGPVFAPRVLGIDEKHIVHEMRGVFVDIETGELLEMTATNKRDDIIGTIESMVDYDKNIQIVTMDMSNGYRSYIQDCLPHAKIIVDKYHVLQSLKDKVTKSRKKIYECISKKIMAIIDPAEKDHLQKVLRLVADDRYMFKYGSDHLDEQPTRKKALAEVCAIFPEFGHLFTLKSKFENIYKAQNRAQAEELAAEWLEYVPPKGAKDIAVWEARYKVPADLFADFRSLKTTLSKWYEEILGYFDEGCSFTNAATEGLNNMIERINRQGNGYSFARLRAKALLYHLAAPRTNYRINLKKIPQKTDRPSKKPEWSTSLMTSYNLPQVQYIEEQFIVEIEVPFKQRKPLSVFSYLPKE